MPLAGLTAVLVLSGCGGGAVAGVPSGSSLTAPPAGAPGLQVEVVAYGLDHPWDVAQAPDGTLLLDERPGGLTAVLPDGTVQPVAADFGDLFARGETGLMGLVLDPGFAVNRRFYTCQGVTDGGADGGPGIELVAWAVDAQWTAATRVADPLLGGIPVNAASGRHGGCRLRFDRTGALLVGTGDNAVGSNAQDLGSLAGKVLRIDAATGGPAAGNPFAADAGPRTRLVLSYGHRNVQGIAVQPGTDAVYTVEQGTGRDDEVNSSVAGGNFGYDPDGAHGGYDESVPMTDLDLPGAVPAVWSSGDPTIATSGATFLDGEEWGSYEGLLLVGVQKDTGVLALRIGPDGALVEQFRLPEVEDDYGRIRSPQLGSDGALYLTTDNGDGEDLLLRVTPH
ncbi:Glucose/arabinose dehydrogenase, beta-propeller fold [Modestobacter sp. DSM 44400]|uniref:PQQ-dependent sugar dehydrogenase n=1 Tax=Modestobacter sp. DSM 44400 TaxID=1550230 RepID=UPI00089740A2|nr:PQQ-dependent sugar dehydrogenase [Modestobacter sp. DSM 44400]SDX53584.1 Glucose/arabinose dehydrogenase, beta-propeller fold [Modestobacter sp. DSM 44400]